MGMGKIIIDGEEKEFSFGIDEKEIERNKEVSEDTIDLNEVLKAINEQNKENK